MLEGGHGFPVTILGLLQFASSQRFSRSRDQKQIRLMAGIIHRPERIGRRPADRQTATFGDVGLLDRAQHLQGRILRDCRRAHGKRESSSGDQS